MDDAVTGFLQAAIAASFLAKLAVDGVKMAADLPKWAPVLLAFVAAMIFEFLLLLAQEIAFNQKTYATGAIVGFIAWGLAIGSTSLQTKADKVNERVEAAKSLSPEATNADVDAKVKETEKKA